MISTFIEISHPMIVIFTLYLFILAIIGKRDKLFIYIFLKDIAQKIMFITVIEYTS